MKYLFKYDKVSPDGFYVSHKIFLTKEERHKLQTDGNDIEVVGVCVIVTVVGTGTNEPAKEIFCRYKIITTENCPKVVELNDDSSWTIYLTLDQAKCLDDIRDISKNPGAEFLATARQDMLTINGISHPITHQLVISDLKGLDDSLYLVHLPQTSSK